jgi:hypothetical protein
MKNETEEFLAEGMIRYKQAASVLVSFGKEVEARLKSILNKRRDWGQFIPKGDTRAKSTTYWSEYPLLNAKLDGEFKGDNVKIVIAVNWYQSQSDYPFYYVRIESVDQYLARLWQYEWDSKFEFKKKALRFYPNPDDFDLARDFDALLDEFIGFLTE